MRILFQIIRLNICVALVSSFLIQPFSVFAQESSSSEIPIESTPASETTSPEPIFSIDPLAPFDEPENVSGSNESPSPTSSPDDQGEEILDETPSFDLDANDQPEGAELLEEDGGEGGLELLGGDETALPGGLNGQFSPDLKHLPETDLSTGALTYGYPVIVPPGRNGVEPNISLIYNNQEANNIENILGYGWSINIPYVERISRTGVEDLYLQPSSASFKSSLSGELTRVSSGSYGPKIDNSDFLRYTLASNSWSLTDKDGKTYLFGQTASSQQVDSGKIFKWMLSKITDSNGNFITYEYLRDNGQIYPATISWTGFNSDPGIFKLHFQRETREDDDVYYTPGFEVRNNYRISRIEARINNVWVRRYNLSYTIGDNGRRSLLSGITESGRDDNLVTTTLPSTSFSYTVPVKGWESVSDGQLPTTPLGTQIADVNADGMVDVMYSQTCFQCSPEEQLEYQRTYLYLVGGSENFTTASPQFTPPIVFYNSFTTPRDRAVRTDDLDGNFKSDLYQYYRDSGGSESGVYINNGTGWTASGSWAPQVEIIDTTVTAASQIFDANGDSLPDVFQLGTGSSGAYLNTGTGWESTGLSLPVYLTDRVYIFDANGDGLNDFIKSTGSSTGGVYLNTGTDWELDENFATASIEFSDTSGDTGARVADINGDGLPDLLNNHCDGSTDVHINTGASWSSDGDWTFALAFVDCDDSDGNLRIIDFTGDGMPDISNYGANSRKNKGEKADQLNKITFPQGGFASVSYQSSHEYRTANNNLLNNKLPVIIQTVKSIYLNPGIGDVASTSYVYSNGDYYYNNAFDRQISGFGKVTKIDGEGNETITYFHQGNTATSAWDEPADHRALMGKPFKVDVYDDGNNLQKRTWNDWEVVTLGTNRWFSYLATKQEQIYDGNATHKDKALVNIHNNSNGNLNQQVEYGEVTGNSTTISFSDTGSDKFTTLYTYSSDSQSFYRPKTITKNDQSSNKVNEIRNYYDNQSSGILTDGNLTKQERWASSSAYIDIEKTYNSYGLVIQDKDPRDKIASYSYDQYSLYPVRSDNALGHESSRSFDYSSGKVKRFRDPNNLVFENVYDGLDRLIEERQPDISEEEGEGFMFGGGGESMFSSEGSSFSEPASVSDMLVGKTAEEKANIKGQEIAKIGSIERTEVGKYEIEVDSMNPIEGGVQVFARAWDSNGQIGFGKDGTVDLERFKIINPPILVHDDNGDIYQEWEDHQGNKYSRYLREDLQQSLLSSIANTIDVKNERFGPENIIPGKVGNTTSTFYPSVDGYVRRGGVNESYSTIRNGAGTAVTKTNASDPLYLLDASTTSNQYAYSDWRINIFNTSSIGSDTVSSATLSYYGHSSGSIVMQNATGRVIHVVSANTASDTDIVAADYSTFGNTSFGNIDPGTGIPPNAWSTSGYNNITINASGLAAINGSGYTKWGTIYKSFLDNSFSGSWSSGAEDAVYAYMVDQSGTDKDPKLVVEHTVLSEVEPEVKNVYTYTDTSGSVSIRKKAYLDGTNSATTYIYFDGLNRKLQERIEMESNSYSTIDFAYNNSGSLASKSVPYASSGSTRTTPTTNEDLAINYSYDALSRITRVANAIGSTSYTYDNWKTTIRDPRGKSKNLFQDAYENLTTVHELNNGASYSTSYTYNGNNDLTKITDSQSNVRNFAYDGLSRRLTAQDLHNPADATFGTWTFEYDDAGNLASVSDPKGQLIVRTYDDINRVLTENYTGQSGTEVTYTYDSCANGIGNLCTVLSPGASSSYKYSLLKQRSQERTKIDSITYQTNYTYDRQGNMLTLENDDDSQVKYTYNSAGQLETVQRKESTDGAFIDVITDFDYGPHGKIASQSFANCVTTSNAYDNNKMYRLANISTELVDCEESLMGGGGESISVMFEEELSELGMNEKPQSITELLKDKDAYDRANIKSEEIVKLFSVPQIIKRDKYQIEILSINKIDSGIELFARVWDEKGQIGFGSDGSVDIERFRIINPPILVPDSLGDIIQTWEDDVTGEIKERRLREDLQESLLRVLEHTIQIKQEKFSDDRIIPGKIGKTTSTFYPNSGTGSAPIDGQAGREGVNESFSSIRGGSGNASDDTSTTMQAGHLEATTTTNQYGYLRRGGFGFDTSSIPDADTVSNATLSLYGEAKEIGLGDTDIDIISFTPSSQSDFVNSDFAIANFGITRFATGKTISTISTGAYVDWALNGDGTSHISKTGNTFFGALLKWDLDNSFTGAWSSLGGSRLGTYQADRTGTTQDPKLVVEHSVATHGLQDIYFEYDANSNITEIKDLSSTNAGKTASLSYDDLNRLTTYITNTASVGGIFIHTYGYDSMGNITSKSDEGRYTYATSSFGGAYANPHAVHNISRTASFSYDSNGNLTNIASASSNIATLSWTYDNRMSKYKSTSPTASVSYAYDHTGQRVKVKSASETRHYPTKFYNIAGTTRIKHIFTPDGLLVAMVKGTGASISLHYIHTDHLGGTNVVTNQNGTLESLVDPYEYGELRINQGSPSEQRKYTGHEYDADTTLNYMNARYQSGKWGKFLSQDPVFLAMGDENKVREETRQELKQILSDPQLLNSYSFVRNNPLKYKDDSGKWLETVFDLGFTFYSTYKFGEAIFTGGDIKGEAVNLGLDVAGLALPFVPALGTIKRIDDAVKIANKADDVIGTASNYRSVFQREFGQLKDTNIQVHHTLPQKYEDVFRNTGINIHDPKYLRSVDSQTHAKITSEWQQFQRANPNPTSQTIQNFAKQIDMRYGSGFNKAEHFIK